jgi:hypothetical protein
MGTNDYDTYQAVLLKDGQELVRRSMLVAAETPDRITIDFVLPASIFDSSDYYEVRLNGITADGVPEPVETYNFLVTNP